MKPNPEEKYMYPENALRRWRPLAMALAGAIGLLLTFCMLAAPNADAQAVSNGPDDEESSEPAEPAGCVARGITYAPGDEVILITIEERSSSRWPTIKIHRFICDENGNWREVASRRISKHPEGVKRATLTVQTTTGIKRISGGLKVPRSTLDSPAVGPVMRSSR